MSGSAARRDGGFRFRRLDKPEEFRQAEELQQAVGAGDREGSVSAALQRALQDNGGLVLGAFADIYLAGAVVSGIGWDGTLLYHYSYITLVRPEYRNHHLGYRLKAFQRDEVLRLGLSEVRWVFDPLVSRTAWLHIHRLGARPDRYLPHYYGRLPENDPRGIESDRVRVRWELASPRVENRLSAGPTPPEADLSRWRAARAVIETETGESALRVPTAVVEPSGAEAHLEIPFDLETIAEHEPGTVRKWRHAVRDGFRAALDLGYEVDDFVVISTDHERRSFYLLRPPNAADRGPKA